jgi:phage portal protein BeeE
MFDETSWGSGIEQLGQFFITYCLQPWLTAWEEAVFRSCLTLVEQGTYFAKFNAGALLRGSLKDQAEFLSKALGAGGSQAWLSPNEARENFDLNDIAGGDALPSRMGATAQPAPATEKGAADAAVA